MNEEITKAVRALEKAKQTLDDESLSLNRNLDHIEAHINAALTALREQPAHVGVKRWHEEITGMVPGSALYEGQQEYVRYEDYLSALQPSPAREEAEALVKAYDTLEDGELRQWIEDQIIPFTARHHLGEKP
jgi:hypothetical protein